MKILKKKAVITTYIALPDICFPLIASNDLQRAANDSCESGELELVA
jgi:hypothetical protein